MICVNCRAPLEPEDGHDKCPNCLGMEHLRQGLTEQACVNCSCLSVVAWVVRIDQLERELNPHPPPAKSHLGSPKAQKHRADTREVPAKMRCKLPKPEPLNQKVDTLASEFAQIKAMLLNLQPLGAQPASNYPAAASRSSSEQPPVLSPAIDAREEDVLSIRASENLATVDEWAEDQGDVESDGSNTRDVSGHTSLRGSAGSQTSAIKPVVKMALARLGLDAGPAQERVQSAFFKQAPSTSSFSVPPSAPFIEELQRCWADPVVISRKKAADTGSLLTHFICLALGLLSMKQMERNCIISRVERLVSWISIDMLPGVSARSLRIRSIVSGRRGLHDA